MCGTHTSCKGVRCSTQGTPTSCPLLLFQRRILFSAYSSRNFLCLYIPFCVPREKVHVPVCVLHRRCHIIPTVLSLFIFMRLLLESLALAPEDPSHSFSCYAILQIRNVYSTRSEEFGEGVLKPLKFIVWWLAPIIGEEVILDFFTFPKIPITLRIFPLNICSKPGFLMAAFSPARCLLSPLYSFASIN